MRYSHFDHTADIGIDLEASTLAELFEVAGSALFGVIAEPEGIEALQHRRIEARGANLEELMVRWLSELLYLHDTEGLLFCRFTVEGIEAGRLQAVASGEPYAAGRHVIRTEIKAITYHQIMVKQEDGAWKGRVILDV